MLLWPSIACIVLLIFGALLLVWLSAIDLKMRLLPDELTLAFAVTGILFRFAAYPHAGSWIDAVLGCIAGGGALALVRSVANRFYGFETMGLGDVKLMAAAGIWLGIEGAITALCVGALCGVAHGLIVLFYRRIKNKSDDTFREMTIPAGPGFCAGVAIVALLHFNGALPLFGGL